MIRKNLQHIQLKHSDYRGEFDNLEKIEHLDFAAGFPPFLRGINTTMYVCKPWIIWQDLDYSHDVKPDLVCYLTEVEVTADIEIAQTLLKGLEKIKTGLSSGKKIDELAASLSFSFRLGMNHFMEIAKLRAARLIWAKLIQQFHPKAPKSMALIIYCQISERSLIPNESYENVARTCVEAMAGIFGGTQSLHISVLDESVTNSDNFLDKMALNSQFYLQEETKITKTVDPWGGSFYVESLTHELVQRAWKRIEETEKLD